MRRHASRRETTRAGVLTGGGDDGRDDDDDVVMVVVLAAASASFGERTHSRPVVTRRVCLFRFHRVCVWVNSVNLLISRENRDHHQSASVIVDSTRRRARGRDAREDLSLIHI